VGMLFNAPWKCVRAAVAQKSWHGSRCSMPFGKYNKLSDDYEVSPVKLGQDYLDCQAMAEYLFESERFNAPSQALVNMALCNAAGDALGLEYWEAVFSAAMAQCRERQGYSPSEG